MAKIVAAASALVLCIFQLDARRQHSNQTAFSLRWARQMVAQAESLTLSVAAMGQRDPLSWSARLLSQGTDSKILFAEKVQLPIPVKEPETYSLDPDTGIFTYTKVLDFLQGTGIRIRLYTTHTGIFGAKTRIQNDLTVVALFLMISFLLRFYVVPKAAAPVFETAHMPVPTLAPEAEPALLPIILAWVADAKKSLVKLGGHIRELIRSVQKLASVSREAKEHLENLRLKLHQQLRDTHSNQKTGARKLFELASEVENAVSGENAVDEETQLLLKKMLGALLRQAKTIERVEIELEPLVADADGVSQSLEVVSEVSAALSAQIRLTTQGMLDQSRRMSELAEIRDSTKCQTDVAASRAVRSS